MACLILGHAAPGWSARTSSPPARSRTARRWTAPTTSSVATTATTARRSASSRSSTRSSRARPGHRLAVGGTLTEAVTGSRPDACALVRRETVLRIDVPAMDVDGVEVRQLAIEDITNLRIVEADDGASCSRQVTELAFSDSARVTDRRGGEGVRGWRQPHRLDPPGRGRRHELLRKRPADPDLPPRERRLARSLAALRHGGRRDGHDHPGRVDFDDVWRFLRD